MEWSLLKHQKKNSFCHFPYTKKIFGFLLRTQRGLPLRIRQRKEGNPVEFF